MTNDDVTELVCDKTKENENERQTDRHESYYIYV